MFHNLNFSKSMLDDVSAILASNRANHDLPPVVIDSAKVLAESIGTCQTVEQKKELLTSTYLKCAKDHGIECDGDNKEELLKFERAVDYFQVNK